MKKILLSMALGMAAIGASSGSAHADLLTYFNFEDGPTTTGTQPMTANGLISDAPGLQSATISTAATNGISSANFVSNQGTTTNVASGNTQVNNRDFTINGGTNNNGKYFQFSISGSNYQDFIVSYAGNRSGTGFTTNELLYSTNGTDFVSAGTATIGTSFATKSFDLSSALNNNNESINGSSSLTFRFFLNGATGTTGTGRFDNIQVNATATPTPEPETWAMMAMGVFALAALQIRRKRSASGTVEASDFAL